MVLFAGMRERLVLANVPAPVQRQLHCPDHCGPDDAGIYGLQRSGEILMTAIWIAVAVLSALSLVFGALLGYASRRFEVEEDPDC